MEAQMCEAVYCKLARQAILVGAKSECCMSRDNVERQLDELAAMQAMYDVTLQIDALELERLHSAYAQPSSVEWSSLPELQLSVAVPLIEADAVAATPCELRVAMPAAYPAEAVLRASCSAPGASRVLDERLNAALCEHLDEQGAGSEAVMAAAMWLSDAAATMLDEAAAAEAAMAGPPPPVEVHQWSRCCFWADKLLEGRTHKPAARTLELACGSGLTGLFFYGRPGIVIAEGPQHDLDDFVREARRAAGKTLRPKKTQQLPEGAASRRFTQMSTVSAGAGDSLCVDRLQQELDGIGLTHKFRFILGLEEIA
eukprot:2450944-Prymnesium_polylepis.2